MLLRVVENTCGSLGKFFGNLSHMFWPITVCMETKKCFLFLNCAVCDTFSFN